MSGNARRWIGAAVGAGLLVAAVITVAMQHETIGRALEAVRHPDGGQVALLAGAILANLVLTALTFSVLMSRYGKVGLGEMQALIAVAALMNLLPLRPGLLGRIAYHKTFNAIPATASAKVVVQAIVLSACTAAVLAAALLAAANTPVPLWAAVGAPLPFLAGATAPARTRVWAGAALLRYAEVMVWAVRYHAAFALIGSPISAQAALAFACVGMVAMLIPLVGNGLGLREWAVGLASPLLAGYDLGLGLTADLVNRAAELAVLVIAGPAGAAWLAWRRKKGVKRRA